MFKSNFGSRSAQKRRDHGLCGLPDDEHRLRCCLETQESDPMLEA